MIINTRAKDYDEIKPLIEFCKTGRLFDVQKWISEGNPVNPPPPPEKKARKRCPLQWSIDKGFHSLVQILLEGGANIKDGSYNALEQALQKRRLDLIKLLIDHGANIKSVEMSWVFDTWDPKIMKYFIDHGADVETEYPLATALSWKIRTALGIFKRYKTQFPSFQEQANMALRHHCREGSLKWVSLLLWAGADPFAKGSESSEEGSEENLCALEYAAIYEHFDIFKLKHVRLDPDHPIANNLLSNACWGDNTDFLIELIKQGFSPSNQKDSGSSLIQNCLLNLQSTSYYDSFFYGKKKNINSSRSREVLKMIHILAKNSVKWVPVDNAETNDARRSLLKMTVDYTIEFVWIMSKYQSCSRENIEQLLKTPTIRRHIAKYKPRIDELLKDFAQHNKDYQGCQRTNPPLFPESHR